LCGHDPSGAEHIPEFYDVGSVQIMLRSYRSINEVKRHSSDGNDVEREKRFMEEPPYERFAKISLKGKKGIY
jgi:hypothetical protein